MDPMPLGRPRFESASPQRAALSVGASLAPVFETVLRTMVSSVLESRRGGSP
ncbi:MAG: hypothetical protein ACRDN9_12475 [Streptosporangiaceae bacterium]